MLLDSNKEPRQELSELLAAAPDSQTVSDKTLRHYTREPGKIPDLKLREICPRLVDAIAKRFQPAARHYLSTLMIAYMKRDKRDFEDWLDNDFIVLKHAFRGAELSAPQDPSHAIGYGTILGLASLWEGLHFEDDARKKADAIREAVTYWQRVQELGSCSRVLTGYLRHRIAVWLGVAAYNAVDKSVHLDAQVRSELKIKLVSLNALAEVRQLRSMLEEDCAPLFYRAIFATVMGEWAQAGEAWLEIEELVPVSSSDYFKTRYANFMAEPIIGMELGHIKEAATQLKNTPRKPSGRQRK